MDIPRYFGGAVGTITGFFAALSGMIDDNIEKAFWYAFLAFWVDFLIGVSAAGILKDLKSAVMRTKLTAKGVQYLALGFVFAVPSFAFNQPVYLTTFFWGVVGIETASIIEKAVKLERFGVGLGPLSPLIKRIGPIFAELTLSDGKMPARADAAAVSSPSSSPAVPIQSNDSEGTSTNE